MAMTTTATIADLRTPWTEACSRKESAHAALGEATSRRDQLRRALRNDQDQQSLDRRALLRARIELSAIEDRVDALQLAAADADVHERETREAVRQADAEAALVRYRPRFTRIEKLLRALRVEVDALAVEHQRSPLPDSSLLLPMFQSATPLYDAPLDHWFRAVRQYGLLVDE